MDIVIDQRDMGILGYALLMVLVLNIILWIAALISIIRNEFIGENEKLMWAVLVVFLPVIGTALYFFAGVKRIKSQ